MSQTKSGWAISSITSPVTENRSYPRATISTFSLDIAAQYLAAAESPYELGSCDELFAELLRRLDHVAQARLDLIPAPRLQAAVRGDPELLRLEDPSGLTEQLRHLLDAGHPRRVDVVD